MKKFLTWTIIIILLLGTIFAGGLFPFIDIIIVRPIVNILFTIYNLVGDFGGAIIIFTILIKLLLWPLMKRQLRQTQLMNRLQPELVKIRKRANGNKQLEYMETMELYKKNHINQFSTLLILCIQLPIYLALYSAINVIAVPRVNDNLSNRAYSFVAYDGSIIKEIEDKQQVYLADLGNPDIPAEEKSTYDYHPQLFGVINLDVRASDVLTGNFSWSAVFILICTILAAFIQYYVAISGTSQPKKSKSLRELTKEAEAGRELDMNDVMAISSRQTAIMMPIMMFFVMFSLHGALAFYFFLSNLINVLQQKIIRHRLMDELDLVTDRGIEKELKNIKEAEVIENKKTGTRLTVKSLDDEKSSNSRKKSANSGKTSSKSKSSSAESARAPAENKERKNHES